MNTGLRGLHDPVRTEEEALKAISRALVKSMQRTIDIQAARIEELTRLLEIERQHAAFRKSQF